MDYTLVKQVRDNAPPAGEFFRTGPACVRPFVRGMAPRGLVDGPLRSYTMVYQDGSAAANVSVNRIDTVWRGEALRLVQLGTVMTAPAHRGKGACPQSDGSRTGRLGPHLRRRLSLCQRHGAGVLPQIRLRPRAREHVCTLPLPARRRSGGGRFCAAGHGHAGRARAAAALL